MSNALAVVAQNTGASVEDITEVLRGMIVSAKNQHGAQASNAELAIVSGVCATYGLNPLVKECAAFISGGKLQIVVMVDGWYKIVNRRPDFDGVEFDDRTDDKGDIVSITCKMFIKNRSKPVTVTEYMKECRDNKSSVWQKWPARMLRHKAYIQAARMAFGISEFVDNDEAERMGIKTERDVSPQATSRSEVHQIDYAAIESGMAECADHAGLDKLCVDIRAEMEKRGVWESEKVTLIEMKGRHKSRIDSYANTNTDEFSELGESEQQEVPFD